MATETGCSGPPDSDITAEIAKIAEGFRLKMFDLCVLRGEF